jgi:hypothetical protein
MKIKFMIFVIFAFLGCENIESQSENISEHPAKPDLKQTSLSVRAEHSSGRAEASNHAPEIPEDLNSPQIVKITPNSIHFHGKNDGITAIISSSPKFYMDQHGKWQHISTNIRKIDDKSQKKNNGFSNTENSFHTFFPEFSNSENGIKIESDGKIISMWNSPSMVLVNSQADEEIIQKQSSRAGSASGNTIQYKGTYLDMTDRFTLNTDQVKHEIMLERSPEIKIEQEDWQYIEFRETVNLPEGMELWVDGERKTSDFAARSGIELRDAKGIFYGFFDVPFVHDSMKLRASKDGAKGSENDWRRKSNIPADYRVRFLKHGISIGIAVPVSWILYENRVFPVTIDPSISISQNWMGYVMREYNDWTDLINCGINCCTSTVYTKYSSTQPVVGMYDEDDGICTCCGDWNYFRGFFQFSTSSIPDGSDITSTSVNVLVASGFYSTEYQKLCYSQMSYKPSDYGAETLYSDAGDKNYDNCHDVIWIDWQGWKDLGSLGTSDLESKLGSNWFAVGLVDNYDPGNRHEQTTFSDAKISVTYKQPDGYTCPGGSGDCISGNCVDGYCCNTACNGNCQRCNSTPGTCTKNDALCTGNCDFCGSDGNCAADNSKCIGNCDSCAGSGTSFSCQGNDSYCTGNCDYCTGGGNEFNCAAKSDLCAGNCSKCTGSANAFNCASDADKCSGNCDICSAVSETMFNCAADNNKCLGNCDYCTGGGTSFNCAANSSLCSGNCVTCNGSGNSFSCTANNNACNGNCDYCSGSDTNYNCAADTSLCKGNCDVCSGSGNSFNCQADQNLCTGNCDICSGNADTYNCQADITKCSGACPKCSGYGTKFDCGSDDSKCIGNCDYCSGSDTTFNCYGSNDLCTGNCDTCNGSGNSFSCAGNDNMCSGNCVFCAGSGNAFTCTADDSKCTGNCDKCSGGGLTFNCDTDDSKCTGNCDYCKKIADTAFNCAGNDDNCTGNCDYCTGSGTKFNCSGDDYKCTGNCDKCTGSGTVFDCTADDTKCPGNCDVCTGSGNSFNCAADESKCTGNCDYCTVSGSAYNCAPLPSMCTHSCEYCSGSGTDFSCAVYTSYCLIGDTCYANSKDNPQNICQYCNSGTNQKSWTPKTSGFDCGLCAACNGTGVCDQVPSDDSDCGTIQCDNLDNTCRNYHNLTANRCKSLLTCKTPNSVDDCKSWTDASAQTDCGICAKCDGSGTCAFDSTQNTDCGLCQKCVSVLTCGNQNHPEDLKIECAEDVCKFGYCDGSGKCSMKPVTTDCGLCSLCDGNGNCSVFDQDQDSECGLCKECASLGNCGNQADGSDAKNECSEDSCKYGYCNGQGVCKMKPDTEDCGICSLCDGSGNCSVYDEKQDNDCALCKECASMGSCKNEDQGSDVKNDCAEDACSFGYCSGSGTCKVKAVGVDCGVCAKCDDKGTCSIFDSSQNTDCPPCQYCGGVFTCMNEDEGDDIKDDCAADICRFGYCNGAGACKMKPDTVDCGLCVTCDGKGNCAMYDGSQDSECGFCKMCVAPLTCAFQPESSDINSDCEESECKYGYCDGAGVCRMKESSVSCGICKSCDGFGNCSSMSEDDQNCGIISCDSFSTECRKYKPLTQKRCKSFGVCKEPNKTSYCTDFMNEPESVDCGICALCDVTGFCTKYDSAQDKDCPICRECSEIFKCANQAKGSDVKEDCPEKECWAGFCSGDGTCSVKDEGSDCGICMTCNNNGECATFPEDDTGCGVISCDGLDTACRDYKNIETGRCESFGNCRDKDSEDCKIYADAENTKDCGVCVLCDGNGSCAKYDDSQDQDCPVCQKCKDILLCENQESGTDLKEDCSGDPCKEGFCDGKGKCMAKPAATDCGICAACDGEGSCAKYDPDQDSDCGLCEECSEIFKCEFSKSYSGFECLSDDCGKITDKGCCDGTNLKFCSYGILLQEDCGNNSCGWDTAENKYSCGFDGKGPLKFPFKCGDECIPLCDKKECGSDGCGSICGLCAKDFHCGMDGLCEPDSKGCGSIPAEGVCDNEILSFCDNGSVKAEICKTDCCGLNNETKLHICLDFAECMKCKDECSTGDSGCTLDGGHQWTCEDSDNDGCLERTYLFCDWFGCENGKCKFPCKPDCKNKECGDDGCGWECGKCDKGYVCKNGKCEPECIPDCGEKECGDDGCGGNCGICPDGWSCKEGKCAKECTASCKDKECGDDGCGGECGKCDEGKICIEGKCTDLCIPQCEGKQCGTDGCSGECGKCGEGEKCSVEGKCEKETTTCPDGYISGDAGCMLADSAISDIKKEIEVVIPDEEGKPTKGGGCSVMPENKNGIAGLLILIFFASVIFLFRKRNRSKTLQCRINRETAINRLTPYLLFMLFFLSSCSAGSETEVKDSGFDFTEFIADIQVKDQGVEKQEEPGKDAEEFSEEEVIPQEGLFGWPCQKNEDCLSSWCIPTAEGKICSKYCFTEECPKGYVCALLGGVCPDCLYVCVAQYLHLCDPCISNKDCMSFDTDTGKICIDYGSKGKFCGAECFEENDCPEKYVCDEITVGTNQKIKQCVPETGECKCSKLATVQELETLCSEKNKYGTCFGKRKCTFDGLSVCDAKTPAEEDCDNIDNDCDGETDEDVKPLQCFSKVNDFGKCEGKQYCENHQWICNAKEASAETCDGIDNDCNGSTDEIYDDTDTDGMADCIDPDDDNDLMADGEDNCPLAANKFQTDTDGDKIGDACDPDDDNDNVADSTDNCQFIVNENQEDNDKDGLGDACDPDDDNDGDPDETDCAPLDKNIFHGASEKCNNIDDNCDGIIDSANSEGCQKFYLDKDKDKFGVTSEAICTCKATGNYSALASGDCDDNNKDIHPGAEEICDDIDNNCIKGTDEGCDDDKDGYCDALKKVSESLPLVCSAGIGDCDDGDANVNPDANEICDNRDNDCDNYVDEDFPLKNTACDGNDEDKCKNGTYSCTGDGLGIECKNDISVDEICGDLIDNDCDGDTDEEGAVKCKVYHKDEDGDGFGGSGKCLCSPAAPFTVLDGSDCDDSSDSVNPLAVETCDNLDNDCDGKIDEDCDEDGDHYCNAKMDVSYPYPIVCPKGGGDCNDSDKEINPEAEEICDDIDNNCDGNIDENCDEDGDGFCSAAMKISDPLPVTCKKGGGDCDDLNPYVNPAAKELCNNVDDNCNKLADETWQDKGQACDGQDTDFCKNGTWTCKPDFSGIECTNEKPMNIEEICGDSIDNDCDGFVDEEGASGCILYNTGNDVKKCLCSPP